MGVCEKCGTDFQAYCAKCRDEIRRKEAPAVPSDDLFVALAYDRKTDLYRYGCTVVACPCNLRNGWCSKGTPALDKQMLERIMMQMHEWDGDNCVKQFCG